MYGSNRFVQKPQRVVVPAIPKKLVPAENGRFVWVDDINPFDGLSAKSFSLKSQLANGVKLDKIPASKLSKVYGADSATDAASQTMANVESAKAQARAKAQSNVE